MKALKLFLLFVMSVGMLVSCDLYSDMDQALVKGDKLEVAPVDPKIIRDTTIVRDTIICGDTIFVVTTDTIFVEVHDTLVIGDTTSVEKLMYVLQHDVDNQGVAMIDNQYTTLKVNSVDALGTNVAFTANVLNDVDTFFVQNVASALVQDLRVNAVLLAVGKQLAGQVFVVDALTEAFRRRDHVASLDQFIAFV